MTGSYCSLNIFLAICFAVTLCTRGDIAQQNLKKLAKSNNYLAVNMLRQISSKPTENIFFSPISLSTVFAILYYGAKGHTAKELRNTLGYDYAQLPEELVHETFQEYLTTLVGQDSSAYVINAANSILVDKHINVNSSYTEGVQNLYQASVKNVDFSTEGRQIVRDVNKWVKIKTNGMIKKVLSRLEPSTILVLLNAIYFKGTWKTQFKPSETSPRAFYNNGLEAKTVNMMHITNKFLYAGVQHAKALEMPYKGENISMVILLPKERAGLESLEKNLSLDMLSEIRSKLHRTKVVVLLPKFKIEYSRDMSNDFKSLGANSIFARGANFSGMALNDDICVTEVCHKAVIEVNEEGSEAAAVTYAGLSRKSGRRTRNPPTFVVDHPFLFTIVDNRNDMILFVGRVTNL